MSKKLKTFIQEHRSAFDDAEAPPSLWQSIDQRLHQKPAPRIGRWLVAASVAGLLCFAAWYLIDRSESPTPKTPAETAAAGEKQEKQLLNSINPAYAKEVYHFTQLIELKQEELKQISKEDPELYRKFVQDISKLDSAYAALKKELPQNPNREQLLEAMINNLQWQMELLNQQLLIIQQIKKSKNKQNESNSKAI